MPRNNRELTTCTRSLSFDIGLFKQMEQHRANLRIKNRSRYLNMALEHITGVLPHPELMDPAYQPVAIPRAPAMEHQLKREIDRAVEHKVESYVRSLTDHPFPPSTGEGRIIKRGQAKSRKC